MTSETVSNFTCPQCSAQYKLVRVPKGDETEERRLTCLHCTEPLEPARAGFVLKYILTRRPQTAPAARADART
jgi:hypothetical protein